MKLYSSPASPFARKCRIVAHELGIALEEINLDPRGNEDFRRINPLGKIPVLILDDGSTLFDSRVICEYLNGFKNGRFFPKESMWRPGMGRWRAAGLQALGDGIADAALLRVYESRLPEERRNNDTVVRNIAAINASVDALERVAPKFMDPPTIGEIAVGCALGYLDFRLPELSWRATRPKLREWHDRFAQYPSVAATAPSNLKGLP
jgi:glutathione S-transferase